ncbi:MAG: ClC family H(+)/Cl(-) exchange transporter, partial [Blautia sp.]
EERFLLTCGASAGLAAAFHAPLAGVMFSVEESHKSFSVSLLLSIMCSSVTADYISAEFLGFEPVFQFHLRSELPADLYWAVLLLGVILGLMGVFYNKATVKVQQIFQSISALNETTRLFVPFLLAGVIGFTLPDLLGSGHGLVMKLADGQWMLGTLLFLFVLKFLFSLCSFGSGAPGGIFFPLLVLGSMIGSAYATAGVQYFGMSPEYISNFIILAMAGYFTAIVRAPLTGIILIFEMTGSLSQMLSLCTVSIVAYVVATLFKSEPIYESLLNRLLERRGVEVATNQERVLMEFVIRHGSLVENKRIREIPWPKDCLIVTLQRGEAELLPKGDTQLLPSDMLVLMVPSVREGNVYDEMVKLCGVDGG